MKTKNQAWQTNTKQYIFACHCLEEWPETYESHLVFFIRAISIPALVVLMSKEPGQIFRVIINNLLTYLNILQVPFGFLLAHILTIFWTMFWPYSSIQKSSRVMFCQCMFTSLNGDLKMSAMRKMMLVTRMRMFLKVNHRRIVCALKTNPLEISYVTKPML